MSAMCNKGIYMPILYTMHCNEKEKGQWPCRQCCKLMAWRTLVQIVMILLWLEAYKSYCLPEKEIKLPFLPSMQSVHSVQTFTPQLGIVQIYVPPYSKRKSDKTTFPASLCHLCHCHLFRLVLYIFPINFISNPNYIFRVKTKGPVNVAD